MESAARESSDELDLIRCLGSRNNLVLARTKCGVIVSVRKTETSKPSSLQLEYNSILP